MNENKKAPEERKVRPNLTTKAHSESELHKDTKISFQNPQRQRVYELFITGEKLTTVKATVELRISDFRSQVRFIRAAGVTISDYWVITKFLRYKVYFLAGCATTADNKVALHEK